MVIFNLCHDVLFVAQVLKMGMQFQNTKSINEQKFGTGCIQSISLVRILYEIQML